LNNTILDFLLVLRKLVKIILQLELMQNLSQQIPICKVFRKAVWIC